MQSHFRVGVDRRAVWLINHSRAVVKGRHPASSSLNSALPPTRESQAMLILIHCVFVYMCMVWEWGLAARGVSVMNEPGWAAQWSSTLIVSVHTQSSRCCWTLWSRRRYLHTRHLHPYPYCHSYILICVWHAFMPEKKKRKNHIKAAKAR